MPNINWTAAAVIVASIIALFQGGKFIIGKIFKLGKVSERLETLEKDVKEIKTNISTSSKELKGDINSIMKMLAEKGLSISHSPRQLTAEGKKVLKNSGMDAIVDNKYDLILKKVKAQKPENPYQAEIAILDVVASLQDDPAVKDAIEEGAFSSGYFVPSVLFVGGLYIRDRILKELDMKPEEIDNHKPKPSQKSKGQ